MADPMLDVYHEGCRALVSSDGWSTGPPDLPCHLGSNAMVYRDVPRGVALHVCLTCLQAYVENRGVLIGPDPEAGRPEPSRACHGCNGEFPLSDFVARSGAITVFCSRCRNAWGKKKRAEEEQAAVVALAGVENGLRRLERELEGE